MQRVVKVITSLRSRRGSATGARLALALTLVLSALGRAAAAEQTILGSQLLVRDPGSATRRTVSGSALERSSANTIVGDPRSAGGVLEVLANGASASAQSFPLPQGTDSAGKPFWAAIGGTGFQYRDARGQNGPVNQVRLQRTTSGTVTLRVSINGRYGSLVVVPPDPGTDGCLALTIAGGDRYSVAYGVDSDIRNATSRSFSARRPVAEGVCPAAPTPTPTPTATPTPTPSAADGCPAASFLDVSHAAGPGINGLMPSLSASCSSTTVTVLSNGIPTYLYLALTPNGLQAKSYAFSFPRSPSIAASTTAVPLLGNVGVAVNGIPIYSVNEGPQPASDAYGNPIAASILDECGSHSAQQGTFHNHALQVKCLIQSAVSSAEPWNDPDPSPGDASPIIGYAFDGFPIYGPYECSDAACSSVQEMHSSWDATGYQAGTVGCSSSAACSNGYCTAVMIDGAQTTACVPRTCVWSNNDYVAKAAPAYLDECNGHVGPNGDYHYHTTATFPYILGCYRGTPTSNGGMGTPPGGSCS